MKLPEYVSIKEVAEICRKLKIRDWTKMKARALELFVIAYETHCLQGLSLETRNTIKVQFHSL